ncbi:8121_t:CDS:2 [Cetraspora pellucida]|uniref:8121_t:CDS:1 n=1 Tax=Cetraspora pellucida TaxID=1433469 RepID=A0A9N9GY21_9GLOM|nr:8121_t:CDS:2 [Cetraspora pellucida]
MNLINVNVTITGIEVTYSDGSPSRWPTEITPRQDGYGNISYYRPIIEPSDKKLQLYLTKLGEALAKVLYKDSGIEVSNSVLTQLPNGYKLFEHIKQQHKSGDIRKDTYLFGGGVDSGIKFRSPNEFIDHLLWLASDKTSPCTCKYCGGKTYSSKTMVKSQEQARFRRGELVWATKDQILKTDEKDTLDCIKFWPAVVIERIVVPPHVLYTLQRISLDGTLKVRQNKMMPWLALDPADLMKQFDNQDMTDDASLFSKFLRAVNHAKEMASMYTPIIKNEYALNCIIFGAEVLKVNDYVRLTYEKLSDLEMMQLPVFKITSMSLNEHNKLEMRGDMFLKMPTNGTPGTKLIRTNTEQTEYPLDLTQIAGRFYMNYPNITRSATPTILTTLTDRLRTIQQEDGSKLATSENRIRKQTAKRSMMID